MNSSQEMPSISGLKSVRALEGYKVFLEYLDGTKGEADFSEWVDYEAFAKLKDPMFFNQVHISQPMGALAWDADIEFCADSLYLELKGLSFEDWQKAQLSHATN